MSCSGCSLRGAHINSETNQVLSTSENQQKLTTTNWLAGYTNLESEKPYVEVRFKNTRKEYFLNKDNITIRKGDMVAVEAAYGHDVGMVSLTGKLAWLQVKKKQIDEHKYIFRKIFRKARSNDIRTYKQAVEKEDEFLIQARHFINELGLSMKLGDVECQGDNTKAIFYYIADGRVDFRELIKILAREFHIRIEMKQIGARQEAGRIGGIGSCGRELCCSSWKTNFQSVSLEAAKAQELPGNVQKLAGQCGKLKCCLMYELDTYMEAKEGIPKVLLELETNKGIAHHQKTDLLKRIMYYSFTDKESGQMIAVPVDRVKEIIALNKKGKKVDSLVESISEQKEGLDYISDEDSIHRFDSLSKNQDKRNKYRKRKGIRRS